MSTGTGNPNRDEEGDGGPALRRVLEVIPAPASKDEPGSKGRRHSAGGEAFRILHRRRMGARHTGKGDRT